MTRTGLCLGVAPLALSMLVPLSALAQTTTPERITEAFGGWEVRCQRAEQDVTDSPLLCEMLQATSMQDSGQPISQIAIGRPGPEADLLAVVQLPLGLWLPSGATLDLGPAGGTHDIALVRCLPAGCIGELPLTEAMQAALTDETMTESALQFEMQPGTPARIPVVHQGFAAALAALEARLSVP
jgi:invasion protein IalB